VKVAHYDYDIENFRTVRKSIAIIIITIYLRTNPLSSSSSDVKRGEEAGTKKE